MFNSDRLDMNEHLNELQVLNISTSLPLRLSYFISWFVPMDSLPFQPLGGTPPLRCGDLGINRSKNHQFRKEITELKIRRRDIEASSLPTTNFTDIPNLAKDSVLFFFFLQEGG